MQDINLWLLLWLLCLWFSCFYFSSFPAAQVGMDGYVALRFIKLCKRLCAFAAFFGEVWTFGCSASFSASFPVVVPSFSAMCDSMEVSKPGAHNTHLEPCCFFVRYSSGWCQSNVASQQYRSQSNLSPPSSFATSSSSKPQLRCICLSPRMSSAFSPRRGSRPKRASAAWF